MRHINVSLIEVIQMVKGHYRDYVVAAVQRQQGFSPLPFPNQSWEFDHVPFMDALLKEIFKKEVKRTTMVGFQHISPAQQLQQAGMDYQYAEWLAAEAYKTVIDTLVAFVPEIEFGNEDAFQYGLCGVYDILITEMPVYN